jgi:hypothetical protein
MDHTRTLQPTELGPGLGSIAKKLGIAGFTFFLVKGLLWLIIPGIIAAAL